MSAQTHSILAKPVFVLSGPNLNRLGAREPAIYGSATLDEIHASCAAEAASLGAAVVCRQTNHEGELIDWLHEADAAACAVVLNPGGLTHTSVALRDAVSAIRPPVIETHLSNPAARETFRHQSYISAVARGVIAGFGPNSYVLAVRAAAGLARAAASGSAQGASST